MSMARIDPRTVGVFIPTMDGKVIAELAGSLIASGPSFGGVSFTSGVSHVQLARNVVAEKFLRSDFQWMVCIDADIGFTPQDFRYLLEPWNQNHVGRDEPEPTRAVVAGRMPDGREVEISADLVVTAEYAFKNDTCSPCKMGLGFTRIHRSVFERLSDLKHERQECPHCRGELEGSGAPRLYEAMFQGHLYRDYYPSGPFVSALVPGGDWKGEDHGFFMLCMLAGIVPRIETRTNLAHLGTKAFFYQGSDAGAGAN